MVNVLQFVADCQPFEEALVVWNSALNRGLVDRSALSRLPLRGLARRLLTEARPFVDSGLETLVASRLRWTKIRLLPQDADNAFDALLVARGYSVIRIGYLQVVEDWPGVQSQLMECIAQGLHLARR